EGNPGIGGGEGGAVGGGRAVPSRLAGVGFGVAAQGGWGKSGLGAAIAAGNDARLALDCDTIAHGPLAQCRQRRPSATMINICHYSSLTPLRPSRLTVHSDSQHTNMKTRIPILLLAAASVVSSYIILLVGDIIPRFYEVAYKATLS